MLGIGCFVTAVDSGLSGVQSGISQAAKEARARGGDPQKITSERNAFWGGRNQKVSLGIATTAV